MKIGVVSDTHIPLSAAKMPEELLKALKRCDLIIHAGDLVDMAVLDELNKIGKVEAVYGNMDPAEVRAALEKKKTLKIGDKKMSLMHGRGSPEGLVEVLKKEFLSEKPDIIIFGHSHKPMNQYIDGILFFNPGSATETVFSPYRSYGIIEIKGDKIEARIHRI